VLRDLVKKYPRAMAAVAVGAILSVVAMLESPLISLSYNWTFDLQSTSEVARDPAVVLVYLDLQSYMTLKQNLDAAGWSRALHAQLLRRLTRANARAVVFDLVFDQPGKDTAADADFAEAMQSNGRVILAAERETSSRAATDENGDLQFERVLPYPRFAEAAAGWGLASFVIDNDFVVRRFFPGFLNDNVPSLTWETARFLKLPSLNAPELKAGSAWLRYYGPPLTIPHVSYSDALDTNAVSDDFFRDKIVFIGARPIVGTFRERKDEFRSPYSSWAKRDVFMPAVEVHATQMLNLVRGDWLRRLPLETEAWLLIAAAFGFSLLLFRFRPLPAAAAATAAEAVCLAAVLWTFRSQALWFPWLIVCAVQIPGALGGSILFHSLEWYRARRRLEALRRQDEARIREQAALIDKAQDAILVQDLQGRVLYANPSAQNLYGWSVAQFQQEAALRQLFAPAAGKLEGIRRIVSDKGEWLGELEQATRTGEKLTVQSRWTLIRDPAGQPKSILLINTDITEKKRLEAQILRTQRMETIGSLAGGMAHDLNNALAPILMGIDLLGRKFQDEEAQQMLAVMEANTHRGADMVRQVLTFARGQDGERERLDVGRLVREMESIVRQTLPKAITIVTLVPSDLWPIVGDATQLHQVLLNLCVNARDAMPKGGELTLAADNVELSAEEAKSIPNAAPGRYVMLLVSDTGTGMAPETMRRIFEPFFTTKAPGQGTGLGLATVARIVQGHAGFVSVKSELGSGTTFEVYLPRAEGAPAMPAKPLAAELPGGHGELILLIDDDRSVREIVATSLVEHGYRVVSAANGVEGLALLRSQGSDIQLVLADLTLPPIDGANPLDAIQACSNGRPLIVMSGEATASRRPSSIGPGLFLRKPFGLDQLLGALAEALRTQPDRH
jgi:PAS domain S-box-containing protein